MEKENRAAARYGQRIMIEQIAEEMQQVFMGHILNRGSAKIKAPDEFHPVRHPVGSKNRRTECPCRIYRRNICV